MKEEYLNLVWIGNWDKFEDVLNNTKFGYNNRPNSSFSYKSPFDMMNEAIINSHRNMSVDTNLSYASFLLLIPARPHIRMLSLLFFLKIESRCGECCKLYP